MLIFINIIGIAVSYKIQREKESRLDESTQTDARIRRPIDDDKRMRRTSQNTLENTALHAKIVGFSY